MSEEELGDKLCDLFTEFWESNQLTITKVECEVGQISMFDKDVSSNFAPLYVGFKIESQ